MHKEIFQKIETSLSDIWVADAAYPAVLPESIEDVMRAINLCRQLSIRMLFVGQGSSFSSKFNVPDNVLTVVNLKREGISVPDAKDMVVEVEAGVPAQSASRNIQEAGFRLDGWPDDYSGTVAGLICGEKGGKYRNLILGMDIVDGRGRCLRFGGRVRKNVSGFDVPGLFAGSHGRIGWMDRIYLRLTPVQSQNISILSRPPRTSVDDCVGILDEVSKAFDPDGLFLKTFS